MQITAALFMLSFLICTAGVLHPADPVTVIVFPLESPAKVSSFAWLSEGLAMSLSDEIRMPGTDVIDRIQRIHLVEGADLPPNAPLSQASMIWVGQLAGADLVVMGNYSGTGENLHISLRVFDTRRMKLSGEIAANGPLASLPQMENELAWNILMNTGLNKIYSREKFRERSRTVPNMAYSYYVRSLEISDEEEQVNLLEKAIGIHTDFPEAQFLLGRNYFERADWTKAIQHLEIGRKRDRTYLHGDFMLGTCYLESNLLTDAIRCYSNLLSFSRPIEALNNLGVAYIRKGDYPLALQDILEARKLAQNNFPVALNLALLRHLEENDSAARAVLEEAIKAHPANGLIQFLLSLVLKALGDENGAAAAFSRARDLGVDVDQLLSQDPRSIAPILRTWQQRP